MKTILKGTTKEVIIERGRPTVIIGERINPTGRKKLAQALGNEDMGYVRKEAIRQVEDGALVIDVNVGAAGIDEEKLLPMAVQAVAQAVEVPLCIDSTHPKALPAALKVCPGRPIVNSVNGEEASLERVLPFIKEHGVAVIGLTMDDDGIPYDSDARLAIAHKIVNRAAQLGIPTADVVIDCLALAVGADQRAGLVALESIQKVTKELGVNVTLGASNVSFGLPDRETINDIFVAMAILAGMNCPLVHPVKARRAILIADMLMGRDEYAMNYLSYYRSHK